jgi:hypothetical protein
LTHIVPYRQTILPPSRALALLRGPPVPDRTPLATSDPRLGAPAADALLAAYRETHGDRQDRGRLLDLVV